MESGGLDENCIFCDIIAGKGEVSTVYEDDIVIVFLTINPINPGHLMVIPKQHFPYLKDMDEITGQHLFKITQRMSEAIRKSDLRCEGINLFLADGEAAFQEIFHLHMHVFPRFKGDPFSFEMEGGWIQSPRKELDEAASKIKASYESLF